LADARGKSRRALSSPRYSASNRLPREWLAAHAISAVPVLRYAEAMRHEHVRARGMLLADANGDLHLDTPIRFEREPGKPNLHVPVLGEHTAEIRASADLR
jgi:crotonobetainyl-CoA:carnitine CoA-transferase CaiB-like acyl-CoA transferase